MPTLSGVSVGRPSRFGAAVVAVPLGQRRVGLSVGTLRYTLIVGWLELRLLARTHFSIAVSRSERTSFNLARFEGRDA